MARVAEMLPNAEIMTAHGADHLLPLRDPATLAAIAAGFMSKHRIPAKV